MSGRKPFGTPWYVGGKSETKLKSMLPVPFAERTKRASAVVGALAGVVKVSVYFFHELVIGVVSAFATT